MHSTTNWKPEGFTSLTPYLVVTRVAELLDFLRDGLGAEETFRAPAQDGRINHASVRLGNSILEMGEPPKGPYLPGALHYYVKDVDATYAKAMKAGAASIMAPKEMDYGDREADIQDASGNYWFIATHKHGKSYAPSGLRDLTSTIGVDGAARFIEFLEQAFGAKILGQHKTPDDKIGHAKIQVGDAVLETSDVHGEWKPRPVALHLYVPDTDDVFDRAIGAGGNSLSPVKDQPYGERSGGVTDPWGNHWYIATFLENLTLEEIEKREIAQKKAQA